MPSLPTVSIPGEVPKEALRMLEALLGPALESSQLLTDQIRYLRFKASIGIFKRAKKISKENGLSINTVPIKFLTSFLDKASLEDNKDLSERWSNLLSNASDRFDNKYYVYSNILGDITPAQADILKKIWEKENIVNPKNREKFDDVFEIDRYILTVKKNSSKSSKQKSKTPTNNDEKEAQNATDELKNAFNRFTIKRDKSKNIGDYTGFYLGEGDQDMIVYLIDLQRKGLIHVRITEFIVEPLASLYLAGARLTPLGYGFFQSVEPPSKKT